MVRVAEVNDVVDVKKSQQSALHWGEASQHVNQWRCMRQSQELAGSKTECLNTRRIQEAQQMVSHLPVQTLQTNEVRLMKSIAVVWTAVPRKRPNSDSQFRHIEKYAEILR